jgi:hypothetical protein
MRPERELVTESSPHPRSKQSPAGDPPPCAETGADRSIQHGGFAEPVIQRLLRIVLPRVPTGLGPFPRLGRARLPPPYVENTRWIAYPLVSRRSRTWRKSWAMASLRRRTRRSAVRLRTRPGSQDRTRCGHDSPLAFSDATSPRPDWSVPDDRVGRG